MRPKRVADSLPAHLRASSKHSELYSHPAGLVQNQLEAAAEDGGAHPGTREARARGGAARRGGGEGRGGAHAGPAEDEGGARGATGGRGSADEGLLGGYGVSERCTCISLL